MSGPLAHVVDDDEAIRDALGWLLASRGIASRSWPSAEAFLADYSEGMCGCVILDVRMARMSGLECFEALLARGCRMPVIFLTGHGDVPLAVSALKRGAFDFIEKPGKDAQLLEVVAEAMARDEARRAGEAHTASISARVAQLTPREREVMACVLAGKANKVIADELAIAMRTVEVHRARLFEKMGVRSAVELAQLLARRE